MMDDKTIKTVNANPAVNTTNSPSGWFIDPKVGGGKYQAHYGTNKITPLICGSEYLPVLRQALLKANKSIYLAIWGFDPMLNLAHTGDLNAPTKNVIGEILRLKAESGVEVKVLIFHNTVVDLFADNIPGLSPITGYKSVSDEKLGNLGSDKYRQQWFARASSGSFANAGFATRPGTAGDISDSNYEDSAKRRKALNYPLTGIIEKTLTDHQKMILIDHEDSKNANGFVQGFNLLPDYFDEIEHPFYSGKRQGSKLIQDIGVRIEGTALVDLYHNFKEAWDNNLKGKAQPLSTPKPNVRLLKSAYAGSPYHVQILRTWPKTNEFNIERFYKNALSKCSDFVFVEDQYFRSPELAEWFLQRAKALRTNGSDKPLYLFVVTNTIKSASVSDSLGEGSLREKIMERFGRDDMVSIDSHGDWIKHLENEKKMTKLREKLKTLDARINIAVLKTYGNGRYRDIYIHSKLTIFNDSYYTLGSANWNIRSMRGDSELNIAVQSPRQSRRIRKKLWNLHFNNTLPDTNDMEEQYEEWLKRLKENDRALAKSEAPNSRAFSYHESIAYIGTIGRADQPKPATAIA